MEKLFNTFDQMYLSAVTDPVGTAYLAIIAILIGMFFGGLIMSIRALFSTPKKSEQPQSEQKPQIKYVPVPFGVRK